MDPDGQSDSDNDPDDPKSMDAEPVDPSELQQLRPNDYLIYRYKVRFLYIWIPIFVKFKICVW